MLSRSRYSGTHKFLTPSLGSADVLFPPFFSGRCMLHFEMQVEGEITMNISWQELYKAALIELDPEQLQRRIYAAETAICERSEELRQAGNQVNEEHDAMADAVRALRVLAQSECQVVCLPGSDPAKGRVMS